MGSACNAMDSHNISFSFVMRSHGQLVEDNEHHEDRSATWSWIYRVVATSTTINNPMTSSSNPFLLSSHAYIIHIRRHHTNASSPSDWFAPTIQRIVFGIDRVLAPCRFRFSALPLLESTDAARTGYVVLDMVM